jgi:uncharacterized protein (PEP-CTERM system associated)
MGDVAVRVGQVALLVGVGAGFAASAQDLGLAGGRNSLQPFASIDQVVTDNFSLSATDKSSESITTASAGVRGQFRSARTVASADYTLSAYSYARHGSLNSTRQSLTSGLQSELVEGRVSLVSSATIGRSAVSAFGATSLSGLSSSTSGRELVDSNSAEVRTIHVAPTARGPLGSAIRYVAAVDVGRTDVGQSSASGSVPGGNSTANSTFQLASVAGQRLGWAVVGTHSVSGFSAGRRTTDDRLYGTLSYPVPLLDLQLGATAGREFSNVSTASGRGDWTWGGSAVWTPSPITNVSANVDHRSFGDTYRLSLVHRTPRTAWQLGGSRSLNNGGTTTDTTTRGTAFGLLYAQLASAEPDPVRRVDLVLTQLQRLGIDPNSRVGASFLSAAATVVNQIQASATWTGIRDTVLVSAQRSQTRHADALTAVVDDLTAAGRIETRDLVFNLIHSLTPQSRLSLSAQFRQSSGQATGQRNNQHIYNLIWSETLSPYITVSLGVRRGLYDAAPAAYTESAITAALGAHF